MAKHSEVANCLEDVVVVGMEDLASVGLMMMMSSLVVGATTSTPTVSKGMTAKFKELPGTKLVPGMTSLAGKRIYLTSRLLPNYLSNCLMIEPHLYKNKHAE